MAVIPTVTIVETIEQPLDTTGVVPQLAKDKDEIERLRSKGKDYSRNVGDWSFFLKSYEGGHEYVDDDTLHKHRREHIADYQNRQKRAVYVNFVQPLTDFVPEYIFSQGVEREAPPTLKAEFELFKVNCDRAGSTLDNFMQQVGEDARIFGMTFVQIDKLPLPAGIDPNTVSVQQASDLGISIPYLIPVRPLEVYDWRCDTLGNFLYLKRFESYATGNSQNTGYQEFERYTEWTPATMRVSVIDVTDKQDPMIVSKKEQANRWKVVPFVPIFYKRKKSNKDIGQSFLQDLAYQNNHVFNLTSLISEFLYKQCFNVLAMPSRTQVPLRTSVEGEMGTSNVLEVPDDSKLMPAYISPPVAPAQFIQAERTETITQMYRTAAQDIMSELFTQQPRSADAQKQSFSRTIPVINKTADILEFGERRIMMLWARMQGESWDGGKISYKDDYSITSLLDLLLQLTQIFNSIRMPSPTFAREEWKRVVREFDGKIPHDKLEKIVNEIDKISDDDIKQLFATPADLQAQMGVPATSNLTQGKKQTQLGTDKRIGAATKSRAATKEAAPDANRRATGGRSAKKS